MIDLNEIFNKEIEKTVFISKEQLCNSEVKQLYGKYYPDTSIFNVFPEELAYRGELLCQVLNKNKLTFIGFEATFDGERIRFYYDGKEIAVESYGLYQSIFSRNKGILETAQMSKKKAVILGCGSVGSLVALELARTGVANFILVDADIVEYHNICRHQCGIEDVGDLKVNALSRKILNINPHANIEVFEGIVQNLPKETLDAFCVPNNTIFVGCADNRAADVYTNRISIYYSSAFVSIGFWERAYAGEIFYHIPGKGMPCYECALGEGNDISERAQANHHIYSNQENTEGIKFEPGISVDINFITTIGIKLIIDILNVNEEGFIPRVLDSLTQYTVICNTNNTQIGGEMVDIFSYPLQISTSLMVLHRDDICCKNKRCKYEVDGK